MTPLALAMSMLVAATAVAQQFQFMEFATRPPQPFLPTNAPVLGGYARGDLDGNALVDYLVVEGNSGRALLAQPGGGFVAMALPFGLGAQVPSLRDFDGDGDLDVLLTSPYASRPLPLQMLRRDPTRYELVTLPAVVQGSVQGAAIGNLDGDGDVDLVVSTVVGSNPPLVVLRNLGGGTFVHDTAAIPAGLSNGLWPRLCDFDGDSDLDILASTAAGPFVLLRNQGTSFAVATGSLPLTRIGHTFLCTGDFDGDGFVDAAAVWWNGDLDVLWGTGTGFTFQAAVVPAVNARGLVPADLDGDGDLDLVADRSIGVDILRNTGPRQFVREAGIAEPVASLGVFDVDADTAADLVFTTTAAPALVRCWHRASPGAEDAGFTLGIRVPAGVGRFHMPLGGDVDGDLRTDLLIPSSAGLIVDRARGDGAYTMSVVPHLVASTSAVERSSLADLDNDGDRDLVVATDSALSWWRNNGAGAFNQAGAWPASSVGMDDLRLGDVDGDGDIDLVQATTTAVVLVRNLGAGAFAAPTQVLASAVGTPALDLADLDGDSDLDIVTNTLNGSAGHHVLANDGSGGFAISPTMAVNLGNLPRSLAHADVDSDGDQDLVAAGDSLILLRNNGAGVFARAPAADMPALLGTVVSNVVLADFDADGDVDLFAMMNVSSPAVLAQNDGTGRFVNFGNSRFQPVTLTGTSRSMPVDIDEDGDLDLLVGFQPALFTTDRQRVFVNHLRQLRSVVAPRLGQNAQFDVATGPGFGSSGVAMLAIAFGLLPVPATMPGFAGKLQIDPVSAQVAATLATSTVGVSTAFVPVPNTLALVGLQAWLQAAVLPFTGQPGLTNAVYEVVLR